MEKVLLNKLGEETIHSAKGHFKAADIRRQLITYTIWLCALLNIVSIYGVHPILDKWLAGVGLFGTIALLLWNEGEGKNYRANHKTIGEKYLSLHKEIRMCYFINDCSKEEVQRLSEEVSNLDKTNKPDIPGLARWLAKKAIESKNPETDNWFKEN